MEIVAGLLEWTSVDEENFAKFLDSDTGRRLIPKLLEGVPLLLDRGHVNQLLIRSGEVRGWQAVAQEILRLAHPPIPVTQEDVRREYVSLEDDKAWNDGQKLTPEPPAK
jgi:hypothetical protein